MDGFGSELEVTNPRCFFLRKKFKNFKSHFLPQNLNFSIPSRGKKGYFAFFGLFLAYFGPLSPPYPLQGGFVCSGVDPVCLEVFPSIIEAYINNITLISRDFDPF